jgi:hypothetical protein
MDLRLQVSLDVPNQTLLHAARSGLYHESVLVKPCIVDLPTEIEPSHVQPGTYMSIGIVFPT